MTSAGSGAEPRILVFSTACKFMRRQFARADVFNLTNTLNFVQPGQLNFGTAKTFASITADRDNPDDAREFQLSLKLYF